MRWFTLILLAIATCAPSLRVASALVNVLPCIISPWAPFLLHGDFVTVGYPEYAAKYWPDLNVARMKVIGDYSDYSSYDVVRSYMAGNGGTDCNLVIGPGYSDGSVAISPLIGQPLWIDFASTSTMLTNKVQFPNFLRVVSTDAQGGITVAELLKQFGWLSIFIIKSDDSYGGTYATGVTTEFTVLGGQVVRTFNLLSSSWTSELFQSIFLQIYDERTTSRVVLVVGVSVDTIRSAITAIKTSRGIQIDDELTFIFSDYACSANGAWNLVRNAFCVSVGLNETRFAEFEQRYTSRSDTIYNVSREALELANYPADEVDDVRNEVSSYTALSIDAVFYGLTVLQHYQAANGGALPADSVAAATYAMTANVTFPEGLSGSVGVDANGDRAHFMSVIQNSGTDGTYRIAARDNGGSIEFVDNLYIAGRSYDLRGLSAEQVLATIPAGKVVIASETSNSVPSYVWAIVAIAVFIVFLLAAFAGMAVYQRLRRGEATKFAPKDESEPAAIIFTDIESSTALWAECPQQMVTALELHNTIIRQCLAAHRGYEVKTIGDSFMAAFQSPVDAVDCSLAIQKALHEADWSDNGDGAKDCKINEFYDDKHMDDPAQSPTNLWNGLRVRVGAHYGFVSIRRTLANADAAKKPEEVDESTPYDYFGSTVNVAARIESIGHGGQVLVSKALLDAYDTLIRAQPQTTLTVIRKILGPVSLRGYNEPVHVTQIFSNQFERRVFNRLRIEKADEEPVLDETNNNSDTLSINRSILNTGSKAVTRTSDVGDVAGTVAHFCQKRKLREDDVRFGFVAIDSLTSVMNQQEQRRFLSTVLKAWRIPESVPESEKKMSEFILWQKLVLAGRLGPVANVRELKLFGSAAHGKVTELSAYKSRSFKTQSDVRGEEDELPEEYHVLDSPHSIE